MAYSVLQSASAVQTPAAGTVAATFPNNVISGSKIIVFCTNDAATTITSAADGASNAWTSISSGSLLNGAGGGHFRLWALDTPAGDVGTKPTITVTLSDSLSKSAVLIQEVSGLLAGNTTAMLDGTPVAVVGTGGASTGSPVYSSTAAGEYLIACFGDNGGPTTYTKPTGTTDDTHSVNGNSTDDVAIAWKDSTNGTETGSWALSGTSDWVAILVAFKLAAASASVPLSSPLVFVPRITIPRYRRQLPLMSPQRLAYPAVALGSSFALTAAITASAAIAGTNTEAEANAAALTASAAVAGTNTEAVAVTAPLTASAAVAGTNVETVALTGALTASAAVIATNTEAVAVTGAISSSATVAGTDTKAVATTAAIAPSAAVAGTNVEAVALSAAITASAAVTGTATSQGAGALTASITASAAVAATDTKAIALSAPLTSSLVISGVNVEIVALNSAIAPSAAVAGALALLGVTSPGKVGAFDRASNTVGVADHNVASVGVSDVCASTVGARDKATNTTGTSDRQVSTSGDSSWP